MIDTLASNTQEIPGRNRAGIIQPDDMHDARTHIQVRRGAQPDSRAPTVLAPLGKNTSWGTEIESRNVLFVAR